MTTLKRSVVTRRTVEIELPAGEPYGATWVEVQKMIRAVRSDYMDNAEGLSPDQDPADDAVRVQVRGDGDDARIVFSYELDETRDHGETGARKPGRGDLVPDGRAAQLREIAEDARKLLDAMPPQPQNAMNRMDRAWLTAMASAGEDVMPSIRADRLLELAARLDAAGISGWWSE